MRYFILTYESKKTRHSEGKKTVTIYQDGLHKKGAAELAAPTLIEMEGGNAAHFKLPEFEEITVEQFEEFTDPVTEEPVEAPTIEMGFDNYDVGLGLTVTDMQCSVIAIVLFDLQESYTTKQNREVSEFVASPIAHGTPEELKEFTEIIQLISPLMVQLFKDINNAMLLQLADKARYALDFQNPKEILIDLIVNKWGLEYQSDLPAIEEVKPPAKEAVKKLVAIPDEDIPAFVLPEYVQKCTFDDDLSELNAKLAALKVGESLIINHLSNALYHASKSYSKSSLDLVQKDPSLLQWSKNAPRDLEKEQTAVFGTAFHTMVLEPHLFVKEFVVMPELNLRTNEGKEEKKRLVADALKKKMSFLCADEMKQLKLMHGSVMAHPTARKLFSEGTPEQSIFYRYSENLVLRIRPDWVTEMHGRTFIVDLKSSADADKFEKSVFDYGYDIQDAFYSHIYELATGKTPTFVFCATGKAISMGKYPTRLCILDEQAKEGGLIQSLENIYSLQECLNTGIFGGFETISLPRWAKR